MFTNRKMREDLYTVTIINNIFCKITSADSGLNQNRVND